MQVPQVASFSAFSASQHWHFQPAEADEAEAVKEEEEETDMENPSVCMGTALRAPKKREATLSWAGETAEGRASKKRADTLL